MLNMLNIANTDNSFDSDGISVSLDDTKKGAFSFNNLLSLDSKSQINNTDTGLFDNFLNSDNILEIDLKHLSKIIDKNPILSLKLKSELITKLDTLKINFLSDDLINSVKNKLNNIKPIVDKNPTQALSNELKEKILFTPNDKNNIKQNIINEYKSKTLPKDIKITSIQDIEKVSDEYELNISNIKIKTYKNTSSIAPKNAQLQTKIDTPEVFNTTDVVFLRNATSKSVDNSNHGIKDVFSSFSQSPTSLEKNEVKIQTTTKSYDIKEVEQINRSSFFYKDTIETLKNTESFKSIKSINNTNFKTDGKKIEGIISSIKDKTESNIVNNTIKKPILPNISSITKNKIEKMSKPLSIKTDDNKTINKLAVKDKPLSVKQNNKTYSLKDILSSISKKETPASKNMAIHINAPSTKIIKEKPPKDINAPIKTKKEVTLNTTKNVVTPMTDKSVVTKTTTREPIIPNQAKETIKEVKQTQETIITIKAKEETTQTKEIIVPIKAKKEVVEVKTNKTQQITKEVIKPTQTETITKRSVSFYKYEPIETINTNIKEKTTLKDIFDLKDKVITKENHILDDTTKEKTKHIVISQETSKKVSKNTQLIKPILSKASNTKATDRINIKIDSKSSKTKLLNSLVSNSINRMAIANEVQDNQKIKILIKEISQMPNETLAPVDDKVKMETEPIKIEIESLVLNEEDLPTNDEASNHKEPTNGQKSSIIDVSKFTDSNQSKELNQIMQRQLINGVYENLRYRLSNFIAPLMKFSLELKPSNLGKIEVDIMVRGSNLQVNMKSSKKISSLLESEGAELEKEFSVLGYKNITIEFNDDSSFSDNKPKENNDFNIQRDSK